MKEFLTTIGAIILAPVMLVAALIAVLLFGIFGALGLDRHHTRTEEETEIDDDGVMTTTTRHYVNGRLDRVEREVF